MKCKTKNWLSSYVDCSHRDVWPFPDLFRCLTDPASLPRSLSNTWLGTSTSWRSTSRRRSWTPTSPSRRSRRRSRKKKVRPPIRISRTKMGDPKTIRLRIPIKSFFCLSFCIVSVCLSVYTSPYFLRYIWDQSRWSDICFVSCESACGRKFNFYEIQLKCYLLKFVSTTWQCSLLCSIKFASFSTSRGSRFNRKFQ